MGCNVMDFHRHRNTSSLTCTMHLSSERKNANAVIVDSCPKIKQAAEVHNYHQFEC